ncbi:MAG: glycosyltransferase [Alistipes sp.]|jgi:glycosyltransferase involved in cell wall biosynthesis|nr:glycosyltransferase [Alistipes sp.]
MPKKLTIVIATYNRGEKLRRTLHSLATQTLPPDDWEAIVVNNNSTDDTPAVFTRFATAHPTLSLRMVDEPRQGLSWARNRGIVESRGAVIAIIDDDEEVNDLFAAAYVDLFDRRPNAVMAGGRVVPLYETARPRWMSRFTERPIAGTLDLGPRERLFTRGYPAGGNMAVRREAFDRFGLFDPTLGRTGGALIGGEEKELFTRISRGGEIWWTPDAIIRHIIPESKLTLDYFRRLARGVGASERVRVTLGNSPAGTAQAKMLTAEALKWAATLTIALWFTLTLRPAKARYLIIMRTEISRGILCQLKIEN